MSRPRRTKEDIEIDIREQKKTCTVCSIRKPFSDYYNFKNKNDGKSYRCKDCDAIAREKWEEKNKDAARLSRRRINLKKRYGIDIEYYSALLEKQNYKCGICSVDVNCVTGERSSWSFAVDHDHDTKKVRGLLCNQCNRALGLFKDNIKLLKRAAEYLKEHGKLDRLASSKGEEGSG